MAARMKLRRRETLQAKTADQKPPRRASKRTHVLKPQAKPEILEPGYCLLRIRLPIELTNSNSGRSGTYHRSHQFRRQVEIQLRAWGLTATDRVLFTLAASELSSKGLPFHFPVEVTVCRVLGPYQKLWDVSSGLRGNWKEIEDALVAVGWFHDDKPKWISDTRFKQIADDRKNGPSIIVELRKS